MPVSPDMFFLDPDHQGTLQAQIQEIVAAGILSGRFRPGDRMPSSRSLAKHLGISRITVTLAYTELVADDYLTTKPRSGYYVSDTAPTAPDLPDPPPPAGGRDVGTRPVAWERVIRQHYAGAHLVDKHPEWRRFPWPFIYGQADPQLFNHANWRLCAHQALGRREFDSLTADYAERDDAELIAFIARHTLPRRGILARPEEILVTLGAQNALWIVAQLLLGPGTTVAHEDPGYPGLRDILNHTGARKVAVPVDSRGLPPEALPAGTDVVFTTPSHQCPTTVTMPITRRKALLARARRQDFLIVEDDYEFEMSFLTPPTPALKSLDQDGRVIYVGSFSKSLFPGLRLGYLVAAEPLIREARALRHAMLRHPPGHIQRTTALFLARGHYDAMIRRMRDAFATRRRVMARAMAGTPLAEAGSAGFGGSSFWVRLPEGVDAAALARELEEDGVLIEPGQPFFAGPRHPANYCRLAYSSIAAERIPEGIARILRRL